MAGLSVLLARAFRLDALRSRALVFTGATRNSLVLLPLALALPDAYAITPVIVVTQALVELVGMVIYIRAIPRLIPTSHHTAEPDSHSRDAPRGPTMTSEDVDQHERWVDCQVRDALVAACALVVPSRPVIPA